MRIVLSTALYNYLELFLTLPSLPHVVDISGEVMLTSKAADCRLPMMSWKYNLVLLSVIKFFYSTTREDSQTRNWNEMISDSTILRFRLLTVAGKRNIAVNIYGSRFAILALFAVANLENYFIFLFNFLSESVYWMSFLFKL